MITLTMVATAIVLVVRPVAAAVMLAVVGVIKAAKEDLSAKW